MPSSLERVISRALVFSTSPPVSVCSTIIRINAARLFSSVWTHSSLLSEDKMPQFNKCYELSYCVPLLNNADGYGILTVCPSSTPLGLNLGSTNPGRTNLPQETLDFRRTGFTPVYSLLMPTFSLLSSPACFTTHLHSITERSPTRY